MNMTKTKVMFNCKLAEWQVMISMEIYEIGNEYKYQG